jgi:U3 small nucleolar RNA-associated protein 22
LEPSEADEDEEWGGIAQEGQTTATVDIAPGGKPKKPPTGEELRVINDAKDLFRSSTFKLQVWYAHNLLPGAESV